MNKWHLLIGVVIAINAVFALALIGSGEFFHTWSGSTPTYSSYKATHCTLKAVTVAGCTTGGYAAVWKRGETGATVVQSPFSFRATERLAHLDTNNFPLNQTYDCMCEQSFIFYPSVNCDFQGACILDSATVAYMQNVGGVYRYAWLALVVIGSLALVFSLLGAIFLAGACLCSKKKSAPVEIPYSKADL